MSEPLLLSSQISLHVDGRELSRAVIVHLQSVTVDQHALLPAVATVRLNDPGLELLDRGPFDLARSLRISAEVEPGRAVLLFEGEITALEPDFAPGMNAELVVRAYDRLHRLYRETRSAGHQNVKDSDLAAQIARRLGLKTEVDATATVYPHLAQYNQSDLHFLRSRAARIGFECFVRDGALYFRRPRNDTTVPALTWGRDLLTFSPRMTLAEQVDEVLVRGWDWQRKSAIVGKATAGHRYPAIAEPKNGADWAHAFGAGRLTIVDTPTASQAEADVLAAAQADALSAGFVTGEGEAFCRPDLHPGCTVELRALGERFSGRYWITGVRHCYSTSGMVTQFTVCGTQLGLLAAEPERASGVAAGPGASPVIGLITNVDDPAGAGRVRVQFPWLADNVESGWARLAASGAGPGCGFYAIPAVGDEVIVVFLHGDVNQPLVVGSLWNGRDLTPEETRAASGGKQPDVRTWRSRRGLRITLDDIEQRITLTTPEGHSIQLDDAKNSVSVNTPGDLELAAGGDLKLAAQGKITLKSDDTITVRGTSIRLN